jgi:hypothetical protein
MSSIRIEMQYSEIRNQDITAIDITIYNGESVVKRYANYNGAGHYSDTDFERMVDEYINDNGLNHLRSELYFPFDRERTRTALMEGSDFTRMTGILCEVWSNQKEVFELPTLDIAIAFVESSGQYHEVEENK